MQNPKGYKAYKELNNTFFTQLLRQHSGEDAGIGNSPFSHNKRFVKLLELGDFNQKSILDIGCGLGSFYRFLKDRELGSQYTGFDINQEMLGNAQKLHPEIADRFILTDILEQDVNQQFDYCVSVGPMNLFMDEDTNYKMTLRMIDMMFKYSRIGFAFSMTSKLSRKQKPDTFYYDPGVIMNHVQKFSNNFRIDHSYLPHDFTLFCYKDDFYR